MTQHAHPAPAVATRGGRRPRLGGRITAVTAAVAAAALIAGCSGAAAYAKAPDPPYATFGLNMSTQVAAPGQAVAVGIPVRVKTGSVVLESATLVPLGRYPLPPAAGVGVVTSVGYVGISVGWPQRWPSKLPGHPLKKVPVQPLAGYVLKADHDAVIYYAFRGSQLGKKYYVAGIRLRYRFGSKQGTVTLYQVGVDCAVADPKTAPICDAGALANKDAAALPRPQG
jgi:hypothetical protein